MKNKAFVKAHDLYDKDLRKPFEQGFLWAYSSVIIIYAGVVNNVDCKHQTQLECMKLILVFNRYIQKHSTVYQQKTKNRKHLRSIRCVYLHNTIDMINAKPLNQLSALNVTFMLESIGEIYSRHCTKCMCIVCLCIRAWVVVVFVHRLQAISYIKKK